MQELVHPFLEGEPEYRWLGTFSISVPEGAVQATVILRQPPEGAAYFHVYAGQGAYDNRTPLLSNAPPRAAADYAFSFAVPAGVSQLFFQWGNMRNSDPCHVAFT
ncbi:hypothetical protein [Enterovibrio norvegicus]|uniref:hypothetical protein n=1 Tax=Enterovibrio norvegicus TaxID=188144 RepID=UPI0024B1FE97|nr:hypothetical protein [Enterovibrio norvegicus]